MEKTVCNLLFRPWTGWLALAGLLFSGWTAAAASVSARLDRASAALGETITLSIIFEGVASPGRPNLAGLTNFSVVGTGQRTEMDLARGFNRQTYDFTLSPKQAGDFIIPAFIFKQGAQMLATLPLQVKIGPSGSAVINPATGQPAVFLKLVVPKTEIYLGEVLPVEVQLYVQEGRLVRLPELPAVGFTLGKMSDPSPVSQVVVNHQSYNLVSFKTIATPVKTGPLPLGPATMPLNIPVPNSRPDIFGNRQQRQINLATDPLTIRVLPLPAQNVPPGFSGAVGYYSLNVAAAPTNLGVGDPITVRVQLAGRGLLSSLALPAQPDWHEFKTYPPSSKTDPTDPQGVSGVKNFEQVVIPKNHEIKALPPFVFTFFDPVQKIYRTLTGPKIPLTITPGPTATPPPTLLNVTNASPAAPADLVRIKPHPGPLLAAPLPLLRQGWFLALQFLPPALWLTLLIRRYRLETLANSPRLLRQRHVAKIMRDGLQQLRTLAEARQSDEFFATLFRLLQEQLGERLDLPASSITESVIDERLRPAGLASAACASLHELFQTCNLARYAPFKSKQELAAQIPKVESVLGALQTFGPPAAPAARPAALAALLLLGCVLPALPARAAEISDFDAANKLYEQGKFSEAAFAYQKMADAGQRAPAIYFNLGTAAYKAGQMGRAIAAYREAGRFAPRDADLRANLQFVRKKVNGDAQSPLAPWRIWIELLTLNEWTALTTAALWTFFLLLALREFRPALKKSLRGGVFAAGGAALLLAAGLGAAASANFSDRPAVVVAREAVVRFGPLEESQMARQLPDGSEVLVLDEKEIWLEIRDAAGRSGWVRRDQVQRL